MKKILFLFLALLFSSQAFAASTLVCTQDEVFFSGELGKKITCVATADGTSYSTLAIDKSAVGMYLYLVSVSPGATAPTDNSDLTILQGSASGIDILGASGANTIDNATTNTFRPVINSVAAAVPIFDTLYVAASGNLVASAVFNLTLYFVPHIP
jgi:hypothetical protein